jgi:tetratricopeptide (TPR) repeat protein
MRDRESDLATLRAVHGAAQRGAHGQAAALARAALADGLEHPLLFNLLSLECEQQGELAEAERLLRRALQLAPADIGARNALALLLLRLERPGEALVELDALLSAHPELAYVHASRGNALIASGQVSQAQASFRRALELDPRQGVAHAGLAHIASRRGSYREARVFGERALAQLPGFPDAEMSVARAELGLGEPPAAEARTRRLLQGGRLSALEAAYAQGLLGDILDAQGHYDAAFAAYQSCNRALQQLYAARFGSEAAGALEYARALSQRFEQLPAEAWKAPPRLPPDGGGTARHVFLLGFPRSGTTLLEVILEGHTEVVSLEEHELLLEGVGEFLERPQDLGRLLAAPPATLARLRAQYWANVAAGGAQVRDKVFVDKYPLNTLKLPLIARLFPGAKVLFACRDPRDIVLSCFRHRFRMSAPIYELLTLEGAARYYDAVMQLLLRVTSTLPVEVCLVRHEDLVTAFAREMKRVCDFLGIRWDPAMGDFALRTKDRAVLTPSTAQLVRGLNTEGLGQWHRYRSQLAPVLPVLEPWVQRFYYET